MLRNLGEKKCIIDTPFLSFCTLCVYFDPNISAKGRFKDVDHLSSKLFQYFFLGVYNRYSTFPFGKLAGYLGFAS